MIAVRNFQTGEREPVEASNWGKAKLSKVTALCKQYQSPYESVNSGNGITRATSKKKYCILDLYGF
jgi:hypothetical protein